MIYSYLLTAIGTILLDVMDSVNFHQGSMIFPKTKYWTITTSGTKWVGRDAWHDSKKGMQLCFSLAEWFAYSSGMLAPGNIIYHIGITMAIYYFVHRLFFGYIFLKPEFRYQRADRFYQK